MTLKEEARWLDLAGCCPPPHKNQPVNVGSRSAAPSLVQFRPEEGAQMTITSTTDPRPRHILRSAGAILAALVANVVLSLTVDQFFHVVGVYPPWGGPMEETGDNLLALSYRVIFGILSGYIAARLAPRAPMTHALILGAIGLAISLLGVVATTQMDLGPIWFPIALVIVALPCAWLGGKLYRRA
jgi:hypothetical protein